jgi:hypothetical protein
MKCVKKYYWIKLFISFFRGVKKIKYIAAGSKADQRTWTNNACFQKISVIDFIGRWFKRSN